MLFRIGLENRLEGYRSAAWALEHPGCFTYGPDTETALAAMPAAIRDYTAWVAAHAAESWLDLAPIQLHVEETWEGYAIDENFERVQEGNDIESFFLYEWKPLIALEVERGLKILSWSRLDLLQTVSGLSPEALEQTYPGERWTIAGIIRHIGGADWWYLDRLGLAFPREQVPDNPFERVEKVRNRLVEVLPTLVGVKQVVGVDGEFWSPRKILRRAAWHERDHVEHIRKLLDVKS